MSCDRGSKLDRYVDAELPDAELAEVAAHLRTCPACAADTLSRLQLKRMNQAVGRRFTARPEFRLKIEQSIGAGNRPWWAWRGLRRRWIPAFAALSAFALILVSVAAWLQHSRSEMALSELADLHVATLASANPIDVVSSDRHTVKPWFQGKLPFSFNLPELQNSPFKLVGGRLAYLRQSPGAQLLFEIRKHRISVFVFQNRAELSGLDSGSFLRKKLAFSSETWTEGGLRYFIVGDASPSDVHDLSELLKSAARS
jgi:anti-sigma factor RsiW